MGMNGELSADKLYLRTDLQQLNFETTDDLTDLTDMLGQPRAAAAMQFGIGMAQDGYNIFALGPTGIGNAR